MPRDPTTKQWTYPPGTEGIEDRTIAAKKYNDYIADVQFDLNDPRPIVAGGTGASTAEQARVNLGVPAASGGTINNITITNPTLSGGTITNTTVTGGTITGSTITNATSLSVAGGTTVNDITVKRTSAPTQGAIYFGNTGNEYIVYDGAAFHFSDPIVAPTATITTLNTGAITSTSINTQGNTITSGPINASGALNCATLTTNQITCSTINTQGNTITAGPINSGAISCTTLTTNGSLLTAGPITASGSLVVAGGTSLNTLSTTTITANGSITATGNITAGAGGINTSGPIYCSPTAVVRSGGGDAQLAFQRNDGLSTGWVYWKVGTSDIIIKSWNGAQYIFNDFTAIKAGGGAWDAVSDARTKTVLGNYEHGLAEILTLQPVRYTYTASEVAEPTGEREFIGLVAQDVEVAMPELVTQTDGTINGQPVTDLRHLDVSPLIHTLINAVKELATRIETLEAT